MNYIMRLNEEPFNLIKNDIKKVEYRLNDEKRKNIQIGDTITFYKRPLENESINVEVTDIKHYKSLYDMYLDTFNLYLKDIYQNVNEAVAATPYYTEEDINKYGCLALFIKKL